MLQIYLNNCGYLAFMSLSSSQVNSAPRLPSHRTFTIGMRERLSCLVWRSMISTGFSKKCNVSLT
ncbi:hypothetical protein Hanom_Chr02g00129081 [Helianthus anomalus]